MTASSALMRRLAICSLLLVVLACALPTSVWGQTEYFVTTTGDDTADGASWSTAFLTISNALAQCVDGDIITVSNGTYTTDGGGDTVPQHLLTFGVTIRSFGGGVYGGLANASNTIVVPSTERRFPFQLDASASNAVLDGFTIKDCSPRKTDANDGGGGILMYAGLVQNCIITNCGTGQYSATKGGGVSMHGGTLSNCIVKANANNRWGKGSGIYAAGDSRILNCQILGNYSEIFTDDTKPGGEGAGVYAADSSVLIRNCLIADNLMYGGPGGGVHGGTVESCTIVSNSATSFGTRNDRGQGGGVYGSTVTNSIVMFNTADAAGDNYYGSATFSHSCADPQPSGDGNIDAVSFVSGSYQLETCAAVDGGTNQSWMTGASDLAGSNRVQNGTVDMGCYEKTPSTNDLECAFVADQALVAPPSNVVFTALLYGTSTNITTYVWDFGDGNTASGASLATVTNTYTTAGLYTVTLTVTNTDSDVAAATNVAYIGVWGDTAYVVASNANADAPFHTWATAAAGIQKVCDQAPEAVTAILVSNGTYAVSEGGVVLDWAMTLRSVGGGVTGGLANASNTIVEATGADHAFSISSANVVLDGFTITDGGGRLEDGGGIYMTAAGVVENCIITQNGVDDMNNGGGIYMTGGTVSNCIVSVNRARTHIARRGAGIWASGSSRILSCQIKDNWGVGGGGGVHADDATVLIRNCLITGNEALSGDHGGGVRGGTVESCTIVSNSVAGAGVGGGVYGSTVTNSIVMFNDAPTGTNYDATATFAYSCAMADDGTAPAGTGNTNDVTFVAGSYELEAGTPAIDGGINLPWMAGSVDLAGADRIQGGTVDMGCYESTAPPGGGTMFIFE